MKKTFFLLVMLSAFSLGALDVDVEELKSAGRDVIFVNYEGPHERIDTAAEIKGVGRFLAESLKRTGTVGKYLLKYRIIRAVDEGQQGKFDADIFSIDADAALIVERAGERYPCGIGLGRQAAGPLEEVRQAV